MRLEAKGPLFSSRSARCFALVVGLVILDQAADARAQTLPPEARARILVIDIDKALARKDEAGALAKLKELDNVGVARPNALYITEAKLAARAKDYSRAKVVLEKYFKAAGSSDPNYNEAARVYSALNELEAKAKAEAEVRARAETKARAEAVAKAETNQLVTDIESITDDMLKDMLLSTSFKDSPAPLLIVLNEMGVRLPDNVGGIDEAQLAVRLRETFNKKGAGRIQFITLAPAPAPRSSLYMIATIRSLEATISAGVRGRYSQVVFEVIDKDSGNAMWAKGFDFQRVL